MVQVYAVLLSLVPRQFKLLLNPKAGLFVQNTLMDRDANSGLITVSTCDANDLDALVLFYNGEAFDLRLGVNLFLANIHCNDVPVETVGQFSAGKGQSDLMRDICIGHSSYLSLETALEEKMRLKSCRGSSSTLAMTISSLHSLAVTVRRSTFGTVSKLCLLLWKTKLTPDTRSLISESVWTAIKSKQYYFILFYYYYYY